MLHASALCANGRVLAVAELYQMRTAVRSYHHNATHMGHVAPRRFGRTGDRNYSFG